MRSLRTGPTAPASSVDITLLDPPETDVEYVGAGTDWDEVVLRGNPADREFTAFWLQDGYPVAAMNANIWDVNDHLRSILLAGRRLAAEDLRNLSITLPELAGLGAAAA